MTDTSHVIEFEVHHYTVHTTPYGGHLPFNEKAAHALWHYTMIALCNLQSERTNIVMIGQPDPVYNYKQLFTSVATQYGVTPEEMSNFWGLVDQELARCELPKLPDDPRIRGLK